MKFEKKRLLISRICILIKCKITILEMKYTNFYFLEEKSINERFSHISPSLGYIFSICLKTSWSESTFNSMTIVWMKYINENVFS